MPVSPAGALIVSNGAFKSGSTWLTLIARELAGAKRIPQRFQRPGWTSSSFPFAKFDRVVDHVEKSGRTLFAKTHYNGARHRVAFLDAHPTVRTLIITRDLADIVVSAYHHFIEHQELSAAVSFEAFFWRSLRPNGRETVTKHHRFMATWGPTDPRLFHTTFEDLKADAHGEVARLAVYLDLDVSPDRIAEILHHHSVANRQERSGTGHVRKGTIGDHENYFSDEMLLELRKADNRNS